MTVGQDEAVINNIYVQVAPSGEAESQVITGTSFYVIVQAEIGAKIAASGLPFSLHVTLMTLPSATPGASVVVSNFPNQTGSVTGWPPNVDRRFVFGSVTAGSVDTLYKPIGVLRLGTTQQDVSVREGSFVVVTG